MTGRSMSRAPLHVTGGQGRVFDLGTARMRIIAGVEETGGGFALAEFEGGEGPWTVPHLHREIEESFFITQGKFIFEVDGETIQAGAGDFVFVPKGTPHVLAGRAGGGSLLCLWSPGGLEKMFIELSSLSPGAIRDPATRAEVSSRHDSVPV